MRAEGGVESECRRGQGGRRGGSRWDDRDDRRGGRGGRDDRGGRGGGRGPPLAKLPWEAAQAPLDALVASGAVPAGALNGDVLGALAQLGEEGGCWRLGEEGASRRPRTGQLPPA